MNADFINASFNNWFLREQQMMVHYAKCKVCRDILPYSHTWDKKCASCEQFYVRSNLQKNQ